MNLFRRTRKPDRQVDVGAMIDNLSDWQFVKLVAFYVCISSFFAFSFLCGLLSKFVEPSIDFAVNTTEFCLTPFFIAMFLTVSLIQRDSIRFIVYLVLVFVIIFSFVLVESLRNGALG